MEPTALRRMGWGIALSGLAWVGAGLIQLHIDAGNSTSLAWHILPYALLTTAEILVSATALEFVYSQATAAMKGVIMASVPCRSPSATCGAAPDQRRQSGTSP